MKIEAIVFVIFTIFLFALGVLVTTLFNSAPTTNDALILFYGSFFLASFGLIFFMTLIIAFIRTRIAPGWATLKSILRLTLIVDAFFVALLLLKAKDVLNWATSIVLAFLTVIIAMIPERRIKS